MTRMDSGSGVRTRVEVNRRGIRPAVDLSVLVGYDDYHHYDDEDDDAIKLGLVRGFSFRDILRVHMNISYDTLLTMKKKYAQAMAQKTRPTLSHIFKIPIALPWA